MDTNIKNGVGVPKDRREMSIYLDKEISETWKMDKNKLFSLLLKVLEHAQTRHVEYVYC